MNIAERLAGWAIEGGLSADGLGAVTFVELAGRLGAARALRDASASCKRASERRLRVRWTAGRFAS